MVMSGIGNEKSVIQTSDGCRVQEVSIVIDPDNVKSVTQTEGVEYGVLKYIRLKILF